MNFIKTLSLLHTILIYIYWGITIIVFGIALFLAGLYYKNHYTDPELYAFPDFLFIASTLNLSPQAQQAFDHCLSAQDKNKIYASQIIKDCLSKAGAKFEKETRKYKIIP